MAKTKYNKKEKKKGRSKATVKSDKSKSTKAKAPKATTSALMVVEHVQRGSAPVGAERRFVVQPGKQRKDDKYEQCLGVVDTVSGKVLVTFAYSPHVVKAIKYLLIRLDELFGITPRYDMLPVTTQVAVINCKSAIQAVAVAML